MSKLYVLCECDENSTTDHSQESVSWGELSGYTHAEQVHRHGFCTCEDGPKVYADCLDDCLECGVPMWTEGYIGDDIKLCHPCYIKRNTTGETNA